MSYSTTGNPVAGASLQEYAHLGSAPIITGELAGSATAVQMPTRAAYLVKFKAAPDNAGKVYIGVAGVTKADGTTDTTTGYVLSAGEESGLLPCNNLNEFYRISDNAGDDLVYIAWAR